MLKRFCAHVGCREIIPATETYCPKHRRDNQDRQAEYDASIRRVRDAQYYAFYHSQDWIRMQAYIMCKYHSICLYSYYIDHDIQKAEAVHHIVELKDDWSRRLDIGNLIPLSAPVHDGVIRQMYREDKRQAQAMLFGLLQKWNQEFDTQGVSKKF